MVSANPETAFGSEALDLHALRRKRSRAERVPFTDVDTFEGVASDPITLHKYLYGNGDPVNNVDPTGMFSMPGLLASMGIGAVLGAIGGGTYAAYTGKSIWKGALIGAGLGAAAGAGIYLAWTGFAAVQSGALQRFFLDPRTFQAISRNYWQRFGPANGSSLHHWLLPQKLGNRLPQGIINAGFNLLKMPRIINTPIGGLNQWMGFAVRWGGQRAVVAMIVENGIRILVPVSGYAAYNAGSWLGNELAEEAIEFVEDGNATVTPLRLTPEEERQMQEDAARTLREEFDAEN